jgi:beta-glucosidase
MEGNPILVRNDDQVNMNLGFYNYQGFNAKSPKVPNTPTTLKYTTCLIPDWLMTMHSHHPWELQ